MVGWELRKRTMTVCNRFKVQNGRYRLLNCVTLHCFWDTCISDALRHSWVHFNKLSVQTANGCLKTVEELRNISQNK